MKKLVVLTEGGGDLGYGHVSRCSEILRYFEKQHWQTEGFVDWQGTTSQFHHFGSFSWNALDALLNHVQGSATCLVDSYQADKEKFDRLKKHFSKVVVLDDYKRLDPYGVDLVINPNPAGEGMNYQESYVGGIPYVILREDLVDHLIDGDTKRNVKRVLISLGGRDYRDLLPELIKAFQVKPYTFNVICGNEALAQDMKQRFAHLSHFNFHAWLSPECLAYILNKSDVAISGAGQSIHELAFAGVPTFAIGIDTDQVPNLNYYFNHGFLKEWFYWDQWHLIPNIVEAFDALNYTERVNRSQRGRALVQKRSGSKNIFDQVAMLAD